MTRPSNQWIADISVGPEAPSCFRVTPMDEAIRRANLLLRSPSGKYNSIVCNDFVNGIHAHVTSLWAAYRPTRPVHNPTNYIKAAYRSVPLRQKASLVKIRAEILDEARSI